MHRSQPGPPPLARRGAGACAAGSVRAARALLGGGKVREGGPGRKGRGDPETPKPIRPLECCVCVCVLGGFLPGASVLPAAGREDETSPRELTLRTRVISEYLGRPECPAGPTGWARELYWGATTPSCHGDCGGGWIHYLKTVLRAAGFARRDSLWEAGLERGLRGQWQAVRCHALSLVFLRFARKGRARTWVCAPFQRAAQPAQAAAAGFFPLLFPPRKLSPGPRREGGHPEPA